MKFHVRRIAFAALVALAGCSHHAEYTLGVPHASDFEEPVPVRMSDVQIGVTGDTGLGPDDEPMVAVLIDAEHRDRIREDCEFVLRRERFGTGPLFVDVIPGRGEPVDVGYHFTAQRADVAGAARDWWEDLMERTQGTDLQAELETLRTRMDELAASSQERWDEARPELEAETERLLQELRDESGEAADDLRQWWDDAVERAEEAAGKSKAN